MAIKKSSADRELEALLKRTRKAAERQQAKRLNPKWKRADGKPEESLVEDEEAVKLFKEAKVREF